MNVAVVLPPLRTADSWLEKGYAVDTVLFRRFHPNIGILFDYFLQQVVAEMFKPFLLRAQQTIMGQVRLEDVEADDVVREDVNGLFGVCHV